MPRFKIDLAICNRTGMCYFERPDLFEEGDDGYPMVLEPGDQVELNDAEVEEVILSCPTGALALPAADD